jgi:hypothetical protein
VCKRRRWLGSNLAYRRFTHFDAEATPDHATFGRTFALLNPAVTEEIHQQVVRLACEPGVAPGRKMRTDTMWLKPTFTIRPTAA